MVLNLPRLHVLIQIDRRCGHPSLTLLMVDPKFIVSQNWIHKFLGLLYPNCSWWSTMVFEMFPEGLLVSMFVAIVDYCYDNVQSRWESNRLPAIGTNATREWMMWFSLTSNLGGQETFIEIGNLLAKSHTIVTGAVTWRNGVNCMKASTLQLLRSNPAYAKPLGKGLVGQSSVRPPL